MATDILIEDRNNLLRRTPISAASSNPPAAWTTLIMGLLDQPRQPQDLPRQRVPLGEAVDEAAERADGELQIRKADLDRAPRLT
jgi:hypothetical protein